MSPASIFGLVLVNIVIGVLFWVGILWLAISLATSGIKAVASDCGHTYGIESVVSGDWFCPTNKKK